MILRVKLVALLVFFLCAGGAQASTGKTILERCTGIHGEKAQINCVGFIFGMMDGILVGAVHATGHHTRPDSHDDLKRSVEDALGFCLRGPSTKADMFRAVMSFLEESPSSLDEPISDLVLGALQRKYPCTNKSN